MTNSELLSKQVSELSDEDLELILKEKREKKAKEAKQKRERYVKDREVLIRALSSKAIGMNNQLKELKDACYDQLDAFYEKMLEYGEIPKSNRGNFSIKSDDGRLKIEYVNHVIREFDERSEAAAAHMEIFLKEFVKKNSHKAYDMIKSLLHRKGKDGKFDVNLINRLEQMRDDFDHPEWIKALDLFKESYQENGSSRYIRFYQRNGSTNSFDLIQLNFSAA